MYHVSYEMIIYKLQVQELNDKILNRRFPGMELDKEQNRLKYI